MATIAQTKLVGFCLGNKTNYSATNYANHIWFDPTNKQIILNGIEYIPKKLSELVNDKNFLTSITKSMVENVLTGNITSHTHSYLPLSGGTLTGSLTAPNIYITGTASILPSHYYHYLYQGSTDVYEHFGYGGINKITYGNFRFFDGNGSYKTLRIGGDGTFKWSGTNVSLEGHTHTFASITSKPTTLGGYGITDAATKTGGGASGTWGISVSGNAATASSLTSLTSSDEAAATDTWRKVWISYDNGVTGRPALSSNLAYQASTNTLKVGNLTNVGDITFSAANKNIGTSSVPLSVLWANSVFSSTTLLIGAGTSVMTFDKDGNVAIGKSSVSKYKLDVSGSIYSMSGGITSADGFIKLNSSDSYILLGGGGTKAVSDFATSAVATASTNGLMSAAMFKAEMVKSVGVRQGGTAVIGGGTITNHSVYITQKKNNLTNSYVNADGDGDVKIPNATKDYDGSMSYTDKRKLDGISNYAPKKVVMLQVTFNSNGTATINKGGGDFDITQDAEIMNSEYVEETSANGHYAIRLSFDTATSSNPLINWFNNYFVKFSFMSKSTNGTSDFFINLNSNFDGDALNIQCISTKTKYTDTFDCIWEFY